MVPNHPRYQLRYTRIFTFSVSGNFTVCGQSCGQMQFRGTFQWTVKPCNSPCSKGFRRFGFTRLGYRHGTPKPPALPTALHPDIRFLLSGNFFVCGHSCGQRRFRGEFPAEEKARKCRRCKAFRHRRGTRFGYRRCAPKDVCAGYYTTKRLPSQLIS